MQDFFSLLDRWGLADLRAPYLPEPFEINFPALPAHLTSRQGTQLHLPANMLVPDRETLRDLTRTAVNGGLEKSHLEGWRTILRSKNTANSTVKRHARLFKLQHFWLVLQHRWSPHLQGKTEKLQSAFASWLLPDDLDADQGYESIRKDLRLIATRRGGMNWYRRPTIIDLLSEKTTP